MTIAMTLSCDGTRNGQPCRGALHTNTTSFSRAYGMGRTQGWRRWAPTPGARPLLLCPSPGHDGEPTS